MFKQLVIIAFLLRCSYSVALENCPLSEKEWRSRGKKMNCKLGLSYHCLMDYSGNSTEFCLTRKEYDKRGCPWVLKRGERYFLGEPFTSCINNMNNTYCPIEGTTYYSDELYKYPACLVKEEERQDFTLPESIDDSVTDSSNQDESSWNTSTIIIVIVVVMAAAVVLVLVVHHIWRRRKDKKRKLHLSPSKKLKYDRAIWNLKLAIEKEDNPREVNELYSSLKGMEEEYYSKHVPRDGNIEGSFLRYAVRMDRKETVLFFLQRQKDGLHVFEEDTYGAGKNPSILDAAREKGWSNVVEVLRGIYDPETDISNTEELEKLYV